MSGVGLFIETTKLIGVNVETWYDCPLRLEIRLKVTTVVFLRLTGSIPQERTCSTKDVNTVVTSAVDSKFFQAWKSVKYIQLRPFDIAFAYSASQLERNMVNSSRRGSVFYNVKLS